MRKFEYKAVPAPASGTKAKGVKTTEERFALSITEVLNEMAGDGWEYVRAETLPCDERKGLTGTQTTYQNLLIFRRFQAAAEPLALEAGRPVSVPAPTFDTAPSTNPEVSPRTVSEPVTPRRITSRPPEGNAPPVSAARDD